MGKKFVQLLLLSLVAGLLVGVGSASQVALPDNEGMQSLGETTDFTTLNHPGTDGTDIFDPIPGQGLNDEPFVALEDSQRFVIENREYSNQHSSGERSSSNLHSFRIPEASLCFAGTGLLLAAAAMRRRFQGSRKTG